MTGPVIAGGDRNVFDSRGTDEADLAIISVFHSFRSSPLGHSSAIRRDRRRLSTLVSWASGFIGIAILSASTSASAPGFLSSFPLPRLMPTSSAARTATAILVRAARGGRLRVGHCREWVTGDGKIRRQNSG